MTTTTRLSSKLVRHEHEGSVTIYHWCTACSCCHGFQVPRWSFNGDIEAPTFHPSMRLSVPMKMDSAEKRTICHYVLMGGVICYCSDSPHDFAGMSVPLEDIPPDYGFSDTAMKDLPDALRT